MTPTKLRFALGFSALATFVGTSARADIDNFSFAGITGDGSLSGKLDDRLGIDDGDTTHAINIVDCEAYAGGSATFSVEISPLPTGDYQYAVAYAPPGKTCESTVNPTATAGSCYVVAAEEPLTESIEFKVAFDDLIGSACDGNTEGTATIYVITALVGATTVSSSKIEVRVDLKAPTAPEISSATGGDQRIELAWTDEVNDETETEYEVYWSDATFTDATLDTASKKTGVSALSYAIESSLENGVLYYIGVVAVDQYDNKSVLSALTEATPVQTTDFWEGYQAARGRDPGGCEATGAGAPGIWILGAIGLLVFLGVRRSRRARAAGAALALVLLTPAVGSGARADSPRTMMLSLHGGSYLPDVDSEFAGQTSPATPWQDAFGTGGLTLLRMDLDYELWQDFGTLALGAGFGYGWADGHARTIDGTTSTDEVGFNLVPLTLSIIYRWDWLAVEHGVPLVPYGKFGVTAGIWWATDGKNDISNTADADGTTHEGRGVNWGWHAAGGLMFLLDVFSPGTARGFDEEAGVNNSYIFAEYSYTSLDNFGGDAIVLSDGAFSFGLAFEF